MIHLIYYASKTLNEAQENYTATKKELLIIVFAIKRYRSCIFDFKVTVHTDHFAIKYLMTKNDANSRLIRWILLLQYLILEILDRKGTNKWWITYRV